MSDLFKRGTAPAGDRMGMTARHLTEDDIAAAEQFVWRNGRLLDRLRFAYHFRGGDPERVRAALRPYQNPDGGFGYGLEPDLRGPTSQPEPIEVALWVLFEVASLDDPADDPMVGRACDWLAANSTPAGGVPFVLPSVRDDPRAPWWQTTDDPPASLLPTAAIVGLLHAGAVEHPWVATATAYCWQAIEELTEINAYQARSVLTFLDYATDRERAERAYHRVASFVLDGGHVALAPETPGEVHWPLDFAPRPGGFGRRMFADDIIGDHLDALVARQQPDGGWTFNWLAWTPAVEPEWRSVVTIEALLTLREYGRFAAG